MPRPRLSTLPALPRRFALLCGFSLLALPFWASTQAPAALPPGAPAIAARLPQAAAASATTPGAPSTGTAALQALLGREMRIAGPRSGAYVYDASTHTPLFAANATHASPPASVEKLYTSTTALLLMGPEAHLQTTVLGTGTLDAQGTWQGDLYLRGGGDPTFGSGALIRSLYAGQGANVSALAQQLAAHGIRRVEGQLIGDESFLDALRGGPTTGYARDPEVEGTLSGLSFNRGEVGHAHGAHAPALYAAQQLQRALRALGIPVSEGVAAGPTPPTGTQQLAVVASPPLATLLGLMDRASDNFFAETLLKDLGALFGGAGSTPAGAQVVRNTMIARLGIHPVVVDGSGLSHSDRTTPLDVTSLLVALAGTQIGTILRGDLAVAGRSGTLIRRMRGTVAAGRCQAKTGTLNGVSNLAGWCESLAGHTLAFCFLIDGEPELTAHRVQDAMAIALSRYAP